MAGLTKEGFVPDTLETIKNRIEQNVAQFNVGFDFDPESPDGQLIGIVSAELSLLWTELEKVYNSYDPDLAEGEALKNLGLLTGIGYKAATRSIATIEVIGDVGTLIPEGSFVSTNDNHVFYTTQDITITGGLDFVLVQASKAGEVPVGENTISFIDTAIVGWDSIRQTLAGTVGVGELDDNLYRNLRNRTVMRNTGSLEESLIANLIELGIPQVNLTVDDGNDPLVNGIYITVGENSISDQIIAETIYANKGLGVVTQGTETVNINDSLGFPHDVKFSKAVAATIYIKLNVKFLSADTNNAIDNIRTALYREINSLLVGEDVIWSRLFPLITPYGEAEITSLELSFDGVNYQSTNIEVDNNEYATIENLNIEIQETI